MQVSSVTLLTSEGAPWAKGLNVRSGQIVEAQTSPLFFVFAGAVAFEQVFEFFLEFANILEVAIDGGEADVGDGVEAFEVLHDQFADFGGGALAFGRVHQVALGGVDHGFQLGGRYG